MTHKVEKKFVISGNVIEVYEYENSYLVGYKENRKHDKKYKDIVQVDEEGKVDRQFTMTRAKQKVRRLINSNADTLTKFITLTFVENETDLDYCNDQFNKFIKRLKYSFKDKSTFDLKYIVVVEFQERGAVHYHMLANLDYIPNEKLRKIWGNGYVKINRIDRVDNVGAYVTKYMKKDMADPRLEGRKCYFPSRNLDKPIIYTKKEEVETLAGSLLHQLSPVYETSFCNDYKGKITYRQYNLKRTNLNQ